MGTPDEEYFASINGLERPIGTYLYGRRMYETMLYWETAPDAGQPAWVLDFTHIWREADKVVFSKNPGNGVKCQDHSAAGVRREAIRQMKAGTTSDLTVGGLPSLPKRSERDWWTSAICTSGHRTSEAANNPPHHERLALTCSMRRRFLKRIVHLHYRVTD